MRIAFMKALTRLVKKDKRVMLLTGDLGFSVFEDFARQFPKQYLNCGLAEQNMVGMAAGLALSGKKVFAYSIVPFATMRPFEQVRDDVCLHNLDVKIVGVGGGYSYSQLGATHHSIEDIAIMKVLPNMKVLVPADPIETELAVKAMARDRGPAYLRLGKSKEENLHRRTFPFAIGRSNVLRKGSSVTVIGCGPILKNVLRAAEILARKNIFCKVISMPTVKPLDERVVMSATKTGLVITVEEHSVIGGLGDSVASVLAQAALPKKCRLKKIGVEDRFMKIVGDQEYLRSQNGLSPEQIARSITSLIKKRS
ncbi:MAG: transketolase [Candidatus Brennerbacteria bacterium]|nr:transketolase [Candidatus Brennerbacteria bacterium]